MTGLTTLAVSKSALHISSSYVLLPHTWGPQNEKSLNPKSFKGVFVPVLDMYFSLFHSFHMCFPRERNLEIIRGWQNWSSFQYSTYFSRTKPQDKTSVCIFYLATCKFRTRLKIQLKLGIISWGFGSVPGVAYFGLHVHPDSTRT